MTRGVITLMGAEPMDRSMWQRSFSLLLILGLTNGNEWQLGQGWPASSSPLPDHTFIFPEHPSPRSIGFAYSGGGARAFAAALAQISALQDRCAPQYETGTSGGSWAVAVSRYGHCKLGRSAEPSELTLDALYQANSDTAMTFPSRSKGMFGYLIKATPELAKNASLATLWKRVVYETYLKPAGLEYDTPLTNRGQPYSLFGISIWLPDKSKHAMIAATPLYVGQGAAVEHDFGGLVEPHVFDCELSIGTDMIQGRDCAGMSLTDAVAASSWAIGALLADQKVVGAIEGMRVHYRPPGENTFWAELADGGNVENVHLSGLIQRNVTRIFAFVNSVIQLDLEWNPFDMQPTSELVANDFAALFGLCADVTPSYNYSDVQLFPSSDFPTLIHELQASAKRGAGAVATSMHTTVRNDVLGVAEGIAVNITWFYLADSLTWRSHLPKETKLLLATDPLFREFPHYSTGRLDLGLPEINALSSLVSFVVKMNAHHFEC